MKVYRVKIGINMSRYTIEVNGNCKRVKEFLVCMAAMVCDYDYCNENDVDHSWILRKKRVGEELSFQNTVLFKFGKSKRKRRFRLKF